MRAIVLLIVLSISFLSLSWSTVTSAAGYNSAIKAYERRDYPAAAEQFSTLAEQGDAYAQYMLGKMYAGGEAVARDYLQAYKWLYLADIGGVEAAVPLKKYIGQRMSGRKISEAKRLAAAWQQDQKASTVKQATLDSPEIKAARIVKQVQQHLKEQGLYFGKIDGAAGPGTRNGIKAFQHGAGVREDGKITTPLLALMGISPDIVQAPAVQPPGDEIASFKKELRAIIKKAKRRNSAEPWLIERLEQLAHGDVEPWPTVLFHENFKDRDYPGGEAWRVINGSFRIMSGIGLVGTSNNGWGREGTVDDLAITLLDVLINQKKPAAITRQMAKIERPEHFSSGFTLTVKTGPLTSTEGLLLSCTAHSSSPAGYQVAFHPGSGERAKLFRVSGGNATEVPAKVNPITFADNSDHTFTWSRTRKGRMTLVVDGQKLLSSRETKDSPARFDNLEITHLGREIVFQEIQLRDNSKS